LTYPQEWNDFIECSQKSVDIDSYREVCYEFDPQLNSHDPQDHVALEKLRDLVIELRNQSPE
jgi:oligoribonuclease (3'-5' exoribonuclease)